MFGLKKERMNFGVFIAAILGFTAPFRVFMDVSSPAYLAVGITGMVATVVYLGAAVLAYRRSEVLSALALAGGLFCDAIRQFLLDDYVFAIFLTVGSLFLCLCMFMTKATKNQPSKGSHAK